LKAYLNIDPPDNVKLEQLLIWEYKNTLGNNPKDKYKQNYQACLFYRGVNAPALNCPLTSEQWAVQEINAPDGRQGDRYHAWQKPMEIAERFIRHSTKQGMTVFDPFACTGTFLLAAAKLQRIAYGFEIDQNNADIAVKRGCTLCRNHG
jgi:DNA modification methylase